MAEKAMSDPMAVAGKLKFWCIIPDCALYGFGPAGLGH